MQFVQNVAPYELMKLRVLNGGHAALAYPAGLMGIQYAHEAMQNTTIVAYLNKLVTAEVITADYTYPLPVYVPEKFIDAVGAGDTFFSAFLSEYIRLNGFTTASSQATAIAALQFGLMAATINVQRKGCQPPAEDEVRQALLAI